MGWATNTTGRHPNVPHAQDLRGPKLPAKTHHVDMDLLLRMTYSERISRLREPPPTCIGL